VLNYGTRWFLVFGAAALLAGIVYGVATNEGSGTTVLVFVGAGAVALGLVAQSAGADQPPVVAAAEVAPIAHNAPAGTRPAWPSIWPVAGGAAAVLLGIAAATRLLVLIPAVILVVAVVLGWLFQAWTEHPLFTARFGARLSERLLVPFGLPVAVFALVAIIALSLSRVLLAVPDQASRAIALAVAIIILAGAFTVSASQRMARTALSLLSAFALVALVAAGAVSYAHGERHFEKKAAAVSVTGPPTGAATGPAVSIAAVDISGFSSPTLSLPANEAVPLTFTNPVTGTPHNIGIYDHQGGKELFRGDIVTGPATVTYHLPPLTAGSLYFQCDVHPNMHGTVTVAAAAAGPAARPPAAPSATTTTTAPAVTTTSAPGAAGLATTPGSGP
jgi:plastocyanin